MGVQEYVQALRGGPPDYIVTKTDDSKDKIVTFGNPDRFKLLFKAESRTWNKSTKAMEVGNGCIVQVSSKQLTPEGWRIAEAVAYVPDVEIHEEPDGKGRYLAPPQTTEMKDQ